MRKIDFIGVGASRSGSSWLSSCLAEHPEICFSTEKETHFFDDIHSYQKGFNYYESFFKCRDGNQIKGEFTPGYFTDHQVAKKIRDYNPNVKIIAILRNPVERAYSEYLYNIARELEIERTFASALQGKLSKRYLDRGFYSAHLKQFYEAFPAEQILILDYADVSLRPSELLKEVYNFLDVNNEFLSSKTKSVINTSNRGNRINHIPWLNYLIRLIFSLDKINRSKSSKRFLKKIGAGKLLRYVYKKNTNNNFKTDKPSKKNLAREDEEKLKNLYQHEAKKIKQLTGVSFYW